MTHDDDVMLTSSDFKAGKLMHELGSVVGELNKLAPYELDLVFDQIASAQFALMNLIIVHMTWRQQNRKLDINERLCQVRH